jgi:predicted RNA binding protein YcfA (HicA-like mRNA interferase family)
VAQSFLGKLTVGLSLAVLVTTQAHAVKPSETLLPKTTKAFISVADVDALRDHFEQTQLGMLIDDPLMQPFVEDLQGQIQDKLLEASVRLGLKWEDLEDVYAGEVAMALLQPWDQEAASARLKVLVANATARATEQAKTEGKNAEESVAVIALAVTKAKKTIDTERRQNRAVAMLVDVTGKIPQANELLAKIAKNHLDDGAEQSSLEIAGVTVAVFTHEKKRNETEARISYYCIHEDQLLATDREDVLASILAKFETPGTDNLKNFAPYAKAMSSAAAAMEGADTHVRWFLEPFGYTEARRAYNGGRNRRGTDMLRVLQNQGFTAVQGVGGHISFKTDAHDIRHHTLVYAPAVERKSGDLATTKYDLAARMLQFPNKTNVEPMNWIPKGVATHLTFNWKMKDAFWYAESLVNEFAGDEVFKDVIENIEFDPHGPQINLKKELTDHLGERATVLGDYRLPITPKSERMLVAIEVTDPATVMKTVNKAMENDPAAKKREHNGHIIWELLNEEAEVAELTIDFDDGFGFDDAPAEVVEEDKPFIPNAAVTVANGHLLISTHVDYIVEILKPQVPAASLDATADFKTIHAALVELGSKEDSFRLFTRTDEAYRTTYELLRQGKMPESESLLGKVLNALFTSEDAEEDELREQQLDGSKLPEFQAIRHYLGPAGLFVRTIDDGWTISGCLLTK